eukprot:gene14035-19973_t
MRRRLDTMSAYIHIPFCKKKCFYCDFPVEAVGRAVGGAHTQSRFQDYIDLLCSEIAATRVLGAVPLDTIFFGGGTPSLVPASMIQHILETLDKRFGISEGAEISIEADPGTFDASKLQQYHDIGINRLSVGVQAFQQELLDACGRAHDLEQVYQAVDVIHASSISNWSLDLISGLPGLDAERWHHSVSEAIKAAPTHISVYDLQVEEGTPFSNWYGRDKKRSKSQGPAKSLSSKESGRRLAQRLVLPEDDDSADMYVEASKLLTEAGFEHYEVSNYAKPGSRSQHNQVYWKGTPYYAFGLGAASYLAGRRFSRPAKQIDYAAWVGLLEEVGKGKNGALPAEYMPPQTPEDALLDTIMLRLRTADGLDLKELGEVYGGDAVDVVLESVKYHVSRGLVLQLPSLVGDEHGDGPGRIRLSDPEGLLLSNDIISDIFSAVGSFDDPEEWE